MKHSHSCITCGGAVVTVRGFGGKANGTGQGRAQHRQQGTSQQQQQQWQSVQRIGNDISVLVENDEGGNAANAPFAHERLDAIIAEWHRHAETHSREI